MHAGVVPFEEFPSLPLAYPLLAAGLSPPGTPRMLREPSRAEPRDHSFGVTGKALQRAEASR